MRQTALVIDDELLRRAGEILGTSGIKATIDRAILEVISADARRRAIDQLRTMSGLDLDRDEVMARAWE